MRPRRGYTFTDDVRNALEFAREEASARDQHYVAPEHLLLGLLRRQDAAWTIVFSQLGVNLNTFSSDMASAIPPGSLAPDTRGDFPYTFEAMQVLRFAIDESDNLGYAWVGAEHLLLALVNQQFQPAAKIFTAHRITFDRLRDALARWTPPHDEADDEMDAV